MYASMYASNLTTVKVDYDPDFDKYVFRGGHSLTLVLTQNEAETLYNELMGAMLHKQHGSVPQEA